MSPGRIMSADVPHAQLVARTQKSARPGRSITIPTRTPRRCNLMRPRWPQRMGCPVGTRPDRVHAHTQPSRASGNTLSPSALRAVIKDDRGHQGPRSKRRSFRRRYERQPGFPQAATWHGAQAPNPTVHSMPVSSLAASDIMDWFHGGSKTRSTSASSTVGISSSLVRTSSTRMSPMPQPGAVSVIFT